MIYTLQHYRVDATLGLGVRAQSQASRAAGAPCAVAGGCTAGGCVEVRKRRGGSGRTQQTKSPTTARLKHLT